MTKKRTWISALLALLLVVSLAVPALAAGQSARQPDYSRTGSITVNVTDSAGKPVPGGTLVAYEVAKAQYSNGDNRFVLTADFASSGADLSKIGTGKNGEPEMAAALAKFASEQKLKGVTADVSADGKAVFKGLELGLYLVVQTDAAKGYEPLRPFLVTVPMWDGSKLVYDVIANPKPGTATEDARLVPEVEKVVTEKNGKAPDSSVFTFRLTAADANAPMPEGADSASVTVNRIGAGKIDFGTMWFTAADVGKTYTYKITEVAGNEEYYTYDPAEYTMTVVVGSDAGNVTIDVTCTDQDGNEVDALVFTNVYDYDKPDEPDVTPTPDVPDVPDEPDEPDKPIIPQTGQLWWPVMVLAAIGLLFVIIGIGLRRKQN